MGAQFFLRATASNCRILEAVYEEEPFISKTSGHLAQKRRAVYLESSLYNLKLDWLKKRDFSLCFLSSLVTFQKLNLSLNFCDYFLCYVPHGCGRLRD